MSTMYKNTVITEKETVLHIIGSEIIPRCFSYLKTLEVKSELQPIKKYINKFNESFVKVLDAQ